MSDTNVQAIGDVLMPLAMRSTAELYKLFWDTTHPPTATTSTATSVGSASATLNGSVNPNSTTTTVYFDYGLSASYLNSTVTYGSVGNGSSDVLISKPIPGLTCNTQYFFRARAANSATPTNGQVFSFTTNACQQTTAPTATALAVSPVSGTSVILNGIVTNDGGATILERRFDWGANCISDISGGPCPQGISVSGGGSFSYLLSGLTPNTTYPYRAWARNSAGWSVPVAQSFTTGSSTSPINGVCGLANGSSFASAPTTNLCSSGAPSAVSGSGPWSWSCSGSNGGATANNCSANITQVAPTVYNINVSASPAAGGSVSGGGNWNAGAPATVTASANSGYRFVNWTENGTVVSTYSTYPFTVGASRNLVANFSSSLLIPGNPSPANGAMGVSRVNTTFSWTGGGSTGTVEYAFFIDTNPNPGIYIGWGGTSGTSTQLAFTLQPATTYYWKVKARDSSGAITESPVWQFTTAYSLPDLVVSNMVLNGTIAPGASVTADVTVQNIGNFTSYGGFYTRLYLSRTPGSKETRLTPNVAYSVSDLQPGATQTFNIPVTLSGLQAGESYIDAWVDSTGAGTTGESNVNNNTRSIPISYIDGAKPNVTYISLQNTFVRTGVANTIIVSATDDVGINTLDFYYSVDGGTTWVLIQGGYVPSAQVAYGISIPWTIPTSIPIGPNLLLKAVAHDTSSNQGEGIAGPYTVKDGTVPGITLLSPNGGEILDLGSTQTIRWNANVPNGISNMSLRLYYGNTVDIIADITSNTTGSYIWTVPSPSSFVTNTAKIKITVDDLNGNHNEDLSDNFFTIKDASAPPPAPWTTPAVITSVPSTNWPYTSKSHSSPVVMTDKLGNVHMVYMYTQDDISGLVNNTSPAEVITRQILYKKLVNGTWTTPAVVYSVTQSAGVDYNIGNIRAAVDSNGYPHIVWGTNYGAVSEWQKNDIFYTFFSGTNWSTPENLSSEIRGGFNINSLSWRSMTSLPAASDSMASAVINGKLYVIGGSHSLETQEFNPVTNAWVRKADIAGDWGVIDGSATELNGKIYALGYNVGNIKIYDPVADSWTLGATTLPRGQGVRLAAANGKIYAIDGGRSGINQEYNPATNTWTAKASMPTPRDYAAIATVNNKIYVIGGGGNGGASLKAIEVYDPINDTWTSAIEPPAGNWPASRGGAACVVSGRIYLLGGTSDAKRVFEYDPQTNSWQVMNPMQFPRSFAACGSINSKLYISGGYSGGAQLSSVEEASISSGLVGAMSGSPTIGVDSADKVHVAWNDGIYYEPDGTAVLGFKYAGASNVYHRVKSAGVWSSVAQATTAGGGRPVMTVDQADSVHIVFMGWSGSSSNIGYMKWNAGTWSAPSVISEPIDGYIDLTSGTASNLHIVWYRYDAAAQSSQIRYSAFDGTTWSPSEVISGAGQTNNYYPSVVADSFNRPHVIWEGRTGSGKVLYSMKLGNQWLNPIQVNSSSQYPSDGSSDAALSPLTNEMHVVWSSGYNSNPEVFYNHANVGYATDIFPPSVSVTAPSAGANLSMGSTTAIQWSANDNVGITTVDLHYSADNGATWTLIASSQPNSGTYNWVVPGAASLQIRVTARDAAGNAGTGFSGNLTTSDATAPNIALTSPVAGASLVGNSSVNIAWSATDNVAVTGIDLEYSLDSGTTWLQIAHGIANSGSYAWLVPNTATSTLLIRVTAHDVAGFANAATSQPLTIARANNAPFVPSMPFPLAGGVNVPVSSPVLQWSSGDIDGDALTYQVMLGTAATPSMVGTVSDATYTAGTLLYATRYYWQVVASDGRATTAGPVWSFTTEAAPVPLSACTSISPLASSVMPGNPSPLLTATCNNSPSAYVWSVDGNIDAGATASTYTVPSSLLATVGSHTVTVTANNAGGTGTQAASATITVTASANVALASAGAVASASSLYSSAYPVAAINNNERAGAGWGDGLASHGGWNDGTPNAYPDWVQITFNGSKTIDRVVVYTLQNNFASPVEPTDATTFSTYGVTAFTVQGWDGSAWVTLGTVTGNNLVKRTVNFAAYTTDRIRINITGALAGYSRITEVEAWGVAAVPSCTISPLLPSKIAGATAQLFTATCSNTPTSYAWTVDGGAVGAASTYTAAANLALGPHTVAVTASNGGGTSSPASTTLTVSALPVPSCTISPLLPSKIAGATAQLFTATCSNSPTSYAWTVDGGAVGAASTYTTVSSLALGPHTVAVTASNGTGSSSPASTTLTVSTQPLSACTLISPASPSVTLGSASPLLTATCNNSPSAYVWSVDGNIDAGATASTYTVPSSLLATVGSHTVTVTANNAGGTGTQAASATITVTASANVALASAGAVASASSLYSSAYPVAAINNNERAGAGWGDGLASHGGWNDGTGNAYPDWVQITFNGSKTIDRVVVYTLQNNFASPVEPTDATTFSTYGVTAFTVQGWDGLAWVTLGTVAGNNLVKRTVNFAAYTTDRIRINITGALAGYSRITEVEAWGVAAVPSCTISPLSPSKVAGATAQLFTATCSNSPASYAWTVDGSPAGAASTYTAASNLALGPHTVAVTASNGGGTSPLASTTLTVSTQPLSACTLISPATPSVTLGSASPLLTATCNNAPTAYVWKLNGSTVGACTGSTCTIPALSLPSATTYNVTVTANNAGGAGTSAASATLTVGIAGVDLVPTALGTTATTVVTGAGLAITDTVQNQGPSNVTAASITVKYYLSTDTTIAATDTLLGQRIIAAAALTAGASSTATTTFTVPATLAATASGTPYFIGVIVDATGVQAESNETNNTRASSSPITVRRAGVDLVPTALGTAATSVVTGSGLAITSTVQNQGPSNMALTGIVVKYYLSAGAAITGLAPDIYLGQRTLPALAAGASSTTANTFTVPAATPAGNYYLGMIVDANNAQPELDETNNKRAGGATLAVRKPGVDLVPTALSPVVSSVGQGGNFTVSDTVLNNGASNVTAANITVRYYLSTDSVITAADRLIGSRTIPASALTAGASNSGGTSLTVPVVTPLGNYTLGMMVDATGAQAETNETNNTRTGGTITVTISPTLLSACSAITPATPGITLGQPSPLLTATCSNNPTGYVWKLDGATLSCTAATCTVPAASLPTAKNYAVTVTANNSYGAGTQAASATLTVSSAGASKLNDTGITASQCYEAGSNTLVACNSAGALALDAAQDGMAGRDANPATNSNADGKLGFSFGAVAGGCVQDNVTGLMWEVKTNDGGLRDGNNFYTNYDNTLALQKLNGFSYVAPTQAEIDAASNSVGFKNSVNAAGLCGYSDWRLPTADELQSIVDYGVAAPGPTIDATWFPNTLGTFWSASPSVSHSSNAWYVAFYVGAVDGYYGGNGRNDSMSVRLVRAGQSPLLNRYLVSPDGQEVTDSQTGLIWRRCAEGMNWDGATCAGGVLVFTHEQAFQRAVSEANGSGIPWRLPNVKELASIADRSRINPAIDPVAFPATPSYWFWSSSPRAGYSDVAWHVGFYDGFALNYYGYRYISKYVRLVRAGQ